MKKSSVLLLVFLVCNGIKADRISNEQLRINEIREKVKNDFIKKYGEKTYDEYMKMAVKYKREMNKLEEELHKNPDNCYEIYLKSSDMQLKILFNNLMLFSPYFKNDKEFQEELEKAQKAEGNPEKAHKEIMNKLKELIEKNCDKNDFNCMNKQAEFLQAQSEWLRFFKKTAHKI